MNYQEMFFMTGAALNTGAIIVGLLWIMHRFKRIIFRARNIWRDNQDERIFNLEIEVNKINEFYIKGRKKRK